jgi:hypothetical protein
VIGRVGAMNRAELEARFHKALLTDQEMKSEASWAKLPDPLPRFEAEEDEGSDEPAEARA